MSSTRDPIDLEAQEQAAETAESRAEFLKCQKTDDIKWLMAHAAGRRIVCRLLEETGVHRTSFHTNGSMMALNEGRKQLGYFLTGLLMQETPDAYLKLLKEFQK